MVAIPSQKLEVISQTFFVYLLSILQHEQIITCANSE